MSVGTAGNHSQSPTVVIDELVYQQIMHWVNKSNYEVSGLGKLIVEPSGDIRIISAHLLPQKNTQTTTDIEAADVAKLMFLSKDEPGELRFWWHSHVNMGVFWSGTDLETIRTLAQGGWFVSTVFNKKYQTKTCISMNDPFPMLFDDCPLTIQRVLPADTVASWDKQYEEKVTNMVPKHTPSPKHHQRFPSTTAPVFNKSDREEIARLARIMAEDQADMASYRGLGSDGVYPDLDARETRELGKPEAGSPQDVLRRRDLLEDRIDRYEQAQSHFLVGEKEVPTELARALETAQADLDEVEDELDVLIECGMLDEKERYSHARYSIEREELGLAD